MSTDKALTILIPVYNGAPFLGTLLESFAAYASRPGEGADFLSACEILVVNNRSEDATLKIANSFIRKISNLRVITPETHVPSAEENVFRAFRWARGQFTWVLGCDDIVRFEAMPEVLQIVRDGSYDIAIFNFMQSDKDGRLDAVCNYYMKNRVFEGNLVDFTQRMGFWWFIAGFSGQLVRTKCVSDFDHAGLVAQTSAIYSHVTAYLECFSARRAAIVNVPNVIYRLTDNEIGHWQRAAARFGVFDEYFWTLGYIRQLRYLENRGVIGRDFLTKMIESNRTSFFRPTIVIYDKILNQLQLMNSSCKSTGDRNNLSKDEFDELVDFCEQRDQLARPFLMSLKEIHRCLVQRSSVNKEVFDQARSRLESYRSSFLLSEHFVGVEADYEIYRISNALHAVHRYFRGALLERMRYLDDAEQLPIILIGSTRDELAKKISEVGIGLNWDVVPATLMRFCSQPITHGAKASVDPVLSTGSPNAPPITVEPSKPLLSLQHQLREVYKSRNPYLLRLSAWGMVLALKVARRLWPKAPNLQPGNATSP